MKDEQQTGLPNPGSNPEGSKGTGSRDVQWTPGPWSVECISDCCRVFVKVAKHAGRGTKIILARLAPPQLLENETGANARLMAAAPELYEALEEFLHACPEPQLRAHHNARTALAKARGEL